MGTTEAEPCGYADAALDQWAHRARQWPSGGFADGLETVDPAQPDASGRDVFLYVISGFKKRNHAAAMALIERFKPGAAGE